MTWKEIGTGRKVKHTHALGRHQPDAPHQTIKMGRGHVGRHVGSSGAEMLEDCGGEGSKVDRGLTTGTPR